MIETPARSDKRAQVLLAARKVFLEHGYEGASMDAIAAAASVSKATVYAYFEGKDRLFTEMVAGYCEEQQAAVAEIEAENLAIGEALRRILLTMMCYVAHPKAIAFSNMIVGQAPRFPELGRIFVRSGAMQLQGQLAGVLRRAAERGEIELDDPTLAAELLIGMVRGVVQARSLRAGGTPLPEAELATLAGAAARLIADD
jgi:TetR/AcrR family transcriptional regulator, mexJK operon transcriptional repressor